MTTHTTSVAAQKLPWLNAVVKTLLFLLKNRIKAPRIAPAPSTGDPATDDVTRREFERMNQMMAADYQDQRNALSDIEPVLYELAEQFQVWMNEKEGRLAEREERMLSMFLMTRGQMPGMPGMPAPPGYSNFPGLPAASMPAPAMSTGATPEQAAATALGQAYEGQIIKGDASNPVYKVEGGRKRWILSPDIFNRMGFNWNSIVTLPQATVDKISFGANIT